MRWLTSSANLLPCRSGYRVAELAGTGSAGSSASLADIVENTKRIEQVSGRSGSRRPRQAWFAARCCGTLHGRGVQGCHRPGELMPYRHHLRDPAPAACSCSETLTIPFGRRSSGPHKPPVLVDNFSMMTSGRASPPSGSGGRPALTRGIWLDYQCRDAPSRKRPCRSNG